MRSIDPAGTGARALGAVLLCSWSATAACRGGGAGGGARADWGPSGPTAALDAGAVPGHAAHGSADAGEPGADSPAGPAEDAEATDPAAFLVPSSHRPCPSSTPTGGDEPVSFFFSPARPRRGAPLRIVFVAERPGDADRLTIEDEDGRRRVEPLESWGGPPWAWGAALPEAPEGRLRFCLSSRGSAPIACGDVVVEANGDASARPAPSGVWPVERSWDRSTEILYSAWIARLFLTEPGLTAGWRPLHGALRDARRNLLHDHLGLAEDGPGAAASAVLAPDCGDAPYFLRAYFAWKIRLPFAAHLCGRGSPGKGPGCDGRIFANTTPAWDFVADPIGRFNLFLADGVARFVHSGSARTLPEDEFADFYPVPLSRPALRPGTIFVDPRGHVLILTRWLPGTEDRIGTLFAVDGHPDRSISQKRFSPSTFFFSAALRTGGFKAFRPVGLDEGAFCFASNAALASDPPVTAYSLEQYGFGDSAAFYGHLDRMLNPYPPDPVLAYRDRMELLIELLVDREAAVRVAVDYMESTGWDRIPVPDGPEIFTTFGPWEDYATPARDLRLLVAADEVRGLPALVEENPGLFDIPPGETIEQARERMDAAWSLGREELQFAYRRSDGSSWTLTLGEFMGRLANFERAYNPNDCPEVRWGATEGTGEYATCIRRAPAGQQRLMNGYRYWFAVRRQPSGP